MNNSDQSDNICLILFYSKACGVQSKLSFSKEFKHCNIISYDGKNYVATEFNSQGIITRVLNVSDNVVRFIDRLKMIEELTAIYSLYIPKRAEFTWKPFWSRSCNELVRYSGGIDLGFTFNPYHLFKKLRKYNGMKNYRIDYEWRRDNERN